MTRISDKERLFLQPLLLLILLVTLHALLACVYCCSHFFGHHDTALLVAMIYSAITLLGVDEVRHYLRTREAARGENSGDRANGPEGESRSPVPSSQPVMDGRISPDASNDH